MKLWIRCSVAMLLLIVVGFFEACSKEQTRIEHDTHSPLTNESKKVATKKIYTCPMHPQIRSDKEGLCPICGMDLVLLQPEPVESMDTMNSGALIINQQSQVLANVQTVRAHSEKMTIVLKGFGMLDFVEQNRKTITSRFSGRIEKLYVDRSGVSIRRGQKLFEIYSPDLIQAQNDFLLSDDQPTTYEAARERLQLLGFTDAQLSDLKTSKKVKTMVAYYSPFGGTIIEKNLREGMVVQEGTTLYDIADLSLLWNIAEFYEKDAAMLKINQSATITLQSSNQIITGKISFIYPVINPESRTVKVRIAVNNPRGEFKPNMFTETKISIDSDSSLVIPQSAVVYTGSNSLVWKRDKGNQFSPKVVKTGAKSNGMIQILSGLTDGEEVVSEGGFLLDSEAKLRGNSN